MKPRAPSRLDLRMFALRRAPAEERGKRRWTLLRISALGFRPSRFRLLVVAAAAHLLSARPLWACAACYGQSDSPMAAGMNWGIFSLLAVIVAMLGGVGAFFVFLARRSAVVAAGTARAQPGGSAARTVPSAETCDPEPVPVPAAGAPLAWILARSDKPI